MSDAHRLPPATSGLPVLPLGAALEELLSVHFALGLCGWLPESMRVAYASAGSLPPGAVGVVVVPAHAAYIVGVVAEPREVFESAWADRSASWNESPPPDREAVWLRSRVHARPEPLAMLDMVVSGTIGGGIPRMRA